MATGASRPGVATTSSGQVGPRDAALALLLAFAFFFIANVAVPDGAPLWLGAIVTEAGFVAAVVLVVAIRRLSWRKSLALGPPSLRDLGLAVLGVVALHLMLRAAAPHLEHALRWVHLDFAEQVDALEHRVHGEMDRSPTLMFFALAVLPALGEEALFRGILMSGCLAVRRAGATLLVTSIAFGAIHVLPIRVVLTFVLGFWFGYAVLASGSLWCAVAAHAMNNALALGLPQKSPYDGWLLAAAVPTLAVCGYLLSVRGGALKSGGGGSGGASV